MWDMLFMIAIWGVCIISFDVWIKAQPELTTGLILLGGPSCMGVFVIRLYFITKPRKVK